MGGSTAGCRHSDFDLTNIWGTAYGRRTPPSPRHVFEAGTRRVDTVEAMAQRETRAAGEAAPLAPPRRG